MPSTCFLYHSLVGFVNAPDYDREDCGFFSTCESEF